MVIDLTENEIRHIRSALIYILMNYRELVEDGRLIQDGDVMEMLSNAEESVKVQNELKAIIAKMYAT